MYLLLTWFLFRSKVSHPESLPASPAPSSLSSSKSFPTWSLASALTALTTSSAASASPCSSSVSFSFRTREGRLPLNYTDSTRIRATRRPTATRTTLTAKRTSQHYWHKFIYVMFDYNDYNYNDYYQYCRRLLSVWNSSFSFRRPMQILPIQS